MRSNQTCIGFRQALLPEIPPQQNRLPHSASISQPIGFLYLRDIPDRRWAWSRYPEVTPGPHHPAHAEKCRANTRSEPIARLDSSRVAAGHNCCSGYTMALIALTQRSNLEKQTRHANWEYPNPNLQKCR